MAYTIAWNESAPLGSVAANTIETEFQNLKISIRERMNQILANDWDDDLDDPKVVSKVAGTYHKYNVATATETDTETDPTVMFLEIGGTTDANGFLVVDMDNLTGTFVAGEWLLFAALSYSKHTRVDVFSVDVPTNSISFRVVRLTDGTPLVSVVTQGITVVLVKTS
jgi:hypothetical protein